jgi:hypothetical protein
VIGIVADVT